MRRDTERSRALCLLDQCCAAEPDRAYAPFTVYALLDHNSDFAAAAAALRLEGYGQSGGGAERISICCSPPACRPHQHPQ